MGFWWYNRNWNVAVDLDGGHDSELQPPAVKNKGDGDLPLPLYRDDDAERLRNWSEENKL